METPEVEPQVTRRPAAFQNEHGRCKRILADMFEDDIDALLLGQLAGHALETVLAVVDDVIGAKGLRLFDLVVGADGGDHRAADLLGKLDRRRANAGTAGVNENGFAGLKLGIVEQHVLDGAEGHRERRQQQPHRRPEEREPAGAPED